MDQGVGRRYLETSGGARLSVDSVRGPRRGAGVGGLAAQRGAHAADQACVARLEAELGLEHALASQRLYTDGAELLFDCADAHISGELLSSLVVVRSGQRVFAEAVKAYLDRITYGEDGYPTLIRVPAYRQAEVVVDPSMSFGAPIFPRRRHPGRGCDGPLLGGRVPGGRFCRVRSAARPSGGCGACRIQPGCLPLH